MIRNFTWLTLLCACSMLLIASGIIFSQLPLIVQMIFITVGLVLGLICFIQLIKLLLTHNKEQGTSTHK